MFIRLLGTAAGGGLPQWNCACAGCTAARNGDAPQNGQFSMALSADGEDWLLLNASPDIRQQLLETPDLHPRSLRDSPVKAVLLTNAEIDAVAGLLTLREGHAFDLWADGSVLETLGKNSIFDVLTRVSRRNLPQGEEFQPLAGLYVTSFPVPGKPAWYLEQSGQAADDGDTIGLRIRAKDKTAFVIPACAEITDDLRARVSGADALFFDGTLWRDDEMIRAGLAQKTGASMGHVSISGAAGVIARLHDIPLGQRVLVHINNSNPVLRPGTSEYAQTIAAGWVVGQAGMSMTL
ncbi:pyrroloquinoline quinone biosynthesis protein PqqB [Ketogulonicigenium vulgare]|nr:pyrroloquinoline quinone biosynthesis protein PqqB [Ketogulonicigenium vulgare]ALJ81976.1 pyrroloquinoline quinone biosynthesis protein PqqB [Ketogulonicigenium vulgare]ANW34614.1 pyrroloquinoline quinone biosynthesis protein PqqB [Ketogulonicigenium vulgare]